MLKHISRAMLAAGALALGIGGANAGTATATLNVTLNVGSGCAIFPASLNFGTIPPNSNQNFYGSTTINVICSTNTGYTIDLSPGQYYNSPGLPNARSLSGVIPYNLYQDSAYSQRWGSTSNGTVLGGTGTGSTQAYTVYGWGYTTSAPAAGTYTDVVTMTVSY